MKHIISFSGGKDSTAMLLMMIEKGMKIDDIVFYDTGLEFPEMYQFIENVENYIARKITRIKPKHDWDYYFYAKRIRGKRVGETVGWPYTMGGWCNSRLKVQPFREYYKSLESDYLVYIGIAYDEPVRYQRILKDEHKRAPLYEWGITEKMCLDYLKEKDLINPLYKKVNRLGCWCCPKQSFKNLYVLYKDYPELWERLMQYDKDSPVRFKIDYTLDQIEQRFKNQKFMEDNQITFFDLIAG